MLFDRDTQRRVDLSAITSAIKNYEVDHSGKPMDPLRAKGADTGYTIISNADGTITVSAKGEMTQTISSSK